MAHVSATGSATPTCPPSPGHDELERHDHFPKSAMASDQKGYCVIPEKKLATMKKKNKSLAKRGMALNAIL